MAIELVYCADGNRRFAEIAIAAGFHYGARLPARGLPFAPWFADQDWKKPNRQRYMAEIAKHTPVMATTLDWERDDQLAEVLSWADEMAQYVQRVVIIPKVINGIRRLPKRIGHADVVLGFSVPTLYGGTDVPLWQFDDWPVHLLGGSPHVQMKLAHYMNVVSADGNMANKMAVKRCQFWTPGTARYAKDRYWPSLHEYNGTLSTEAGQHYVAFKRSCENIIAAWRSLAEQRIGAVPVPLIV